jgi:hypothetical protein
MLALLHRYNPRHIVESHGFKAEVRVIGDFIDFLDERVEVESFDAVDGGDEVRGGEAVLVGGTASTLRSC